MGLGESILINSRGGFGSGVRFNIYGLGGVERKDMYIYYLWVLGLRRCDGDIS